MDHGTLNRRHLLLGAAAGLGAAATTGAVSAKGVLKMWPLGVQLWAVNAQLQTDVPGTLKAVKDAGYDVVETAGTIGHTAAEFGAMIRDAGLTCRSAHTSMGDLMSGLDQKIADARALGAEWLVCSSPKPLAALDSAKDWVAAMIEAMTLDAWKANAEQLAMMTPKVKAAGLKFAYHNHPMEFRDLPSENGDGTTGYDILVGSSPDLRLEMDLGWVAAGGRDPVAMMKKYADRIDLLHVKDMVADASAPVGYRSVEVGAGMIDWKAVFTTAHRIGVKGYFVEQEAPYVKPIMTSLSESRAYLAGLKLGWF